MKSYLVVLCALLTMVLVGCASQPVTPAPTNMPPATVLVPTRCSLSPIVVPTRPAVTPGYAESDPTTGLHVTGTAPDINLTSYHLEVTGKVDRSLSLTYDDLRCMRKITLRCTLICPGFFEDEATWAGAALNDVLDLTGVQPEAETLTLVSADGYSTVVAIQSARAQDNFLAYEWEGQPLPILHGFPVRAVFPALSGGYWAKWLVEIRVY